MEPLHFLAKSKNSQIHLAVQGSTGLSFMNF